MLYSKPSKNNDYFPEVCFVCFRVCSLTSLGSQNHLWAAQKSYTEASETYTGMVMLLKVSYNSCNCVQKRASL